MKHTEIRKLFFNFFKSKNHEIIASSSVIPAQDPTILFTNAGMNQFKDCFLGKEKRAYTRAVTIQKCIRAGGKHNDLDNVGFTDRHLTFFEMMGNFSFGDYFKKDAISYAWEFLTSVLSLDKSRLYISVYKDDVESRLIWKTVTGFSDDKITGLDAETNFWQMGDVGPCGPCTEIFFDRGSSFGCKDIKQCKTVACECGRFLEIWNVVFMQFEKQLDGSLKELKQPGVDTGMGLERLCVVMQNHSSVFLTDLFEDIIKSIESLSGKKYDHCNLQLKAAFHVLADHIRSASMIIADGGIPSNEGRGYVLRKIIRRAVLFSLKLTKQPIFSKLVEALIISVGSVHQELALQKDHIMLVLQSETEKFSINVVRGSMLFDEYAKNLKEGDVITGSQAFKLYDTYGFPLELVIAASRERGYIVNIEEFEKLMQSQQAKSGKKMIDALSLLHPDVNTEFTGYKTLETTSTIAALVCDNQLVAHVEAGKSCYVIPYDSPFFIVGGGQVPDKGTIIIHGIELMLEEVRYIDNAIAILITTKDPIFVGDSITQKVDKNKRMHAMKNHTATHLLQAALMEYFKSGIKQSGSLVCPDYLRFDFTFHGSISDEDIRAIEVIVNKKIQENISVVVETTTLDKASKKGALAFFGDKYNAENVRVISIEDFSVELCGGTHVGSTGEIGLFKIIDALTPAAGQKRIHAVTGPKAVELVQQNFSILKQLSQEFKVKREEVVSAIQKQKFDIKQLIVELESYKKELLLSQLSEMILHIKEKNGKYFGAFQIFDSGSLDELKYASLLLNQKQPGLYLLFSKLADKLLIYVSYTKIEQNVNLELLKDVLAAELGFKGGVTKECLQGGIDIKKSISKEKLLHCLEKVL